MAKRKSEERRRHDKEVGARLRDAREAAGLSPTVVAATMGTTAENLRQIEEGETSLNSYAAKNLEDLLGRSASWLLFGVVDAVGEEGRPAQLSDLQQLAGEVERRKPDKVPELRGMLRALLLFSTAAAALWFGSDGLPRRPQASVSLHNANNHKRLRKKAA